MSNPEQPLYKFYPMLSYYLEKCGSFDLKVNLLTTCQQCYIELFKPVCKYRHKGKDLWGF